ncbi:Uu.00g073180.m01.CDS01 [Anthostomella pinea]|uniref:Uu.00g073180.m01.CDS01 n=1 Tax=Anthostomella pinea TaxID=933095 RepID=A0AAI8VVA1_9PEZI|nr:Uu.00g073180.m01.CDS01 [Anthostomella pinea]
MEIPSSRYAPREPGGPPPAIYIDGSKRFNQPGGSNTSRVPSSSSLSPALASIPMSIPNNRHLAEDDAPPPLPPPRYVPIMGFPGPPRHDRIPSIDSSGSWDSPKRDAEVDRPRFGNQENEQRAARPNHRDEGYHSLNSTISSLGSQDSLPKKLFMSHDQYQFNRPSGSDYDNHLLKKLDSRRTFDNRRAGQRLHPQVPQLSLAIRPNDKSLIDSPVRFTETPLHATASPRSMPYYGASNAEYRSPIDPADVDRSPFPRTRRNNSDDATMSTHSSVDDNDFPMEETSGIRRLHIDDSLMRPEYQTVGQKRRASSPPGDDVPMQGVPGSCELLRRREGVSRASPTPRLSVLPPESISSVSSTGRTGSYVSAPSLTTSISSLNSFGGRSPSGISSGGFSPIEVMNNSPYNTPLSLAPSPSAPLARMPHQRNLSNENRSLATPRKVSEVPKASISKIQGGFFMCECCPKKPKKFETAEELSTHEAEKQYECSFCGNRFKNKNEAERHQNSLHVRRHSWSCSALLMSSYDRAFHESTNRPGEADSCGYCGEEFARNGGAGRSRHPTELDWDERLRHLQDVHKFRECNSSKKFFRADHFRQHLKHSHAGTSGKWTNMLENACMLEEDPPQPR